MSPPTTAIGPQFSGDIFSRHPLSITTVVFICMRIFIRPFTTNSIGGGSYWAGRAAARLLFRLYMKNYVLVCSMIGLFNCLFCFIQSYRHAWSNFTKISDEDMQNLRYKTSNFVGIVVYHKRALQSFELQLFGTKIITNEKV